MSRLSSSVPSQWGSYNFKMLDGTEPADIPVERLEGAGGMLEFIYRSLKKGLPVAKDYVLIQVKNSDISVLIPFEESPFVVEKHATSPELGWCLQSRDDYVFKAEGLLAGLTVKDVRFNLVFSTNLEVEDMPSSQKDDYTANYSHAGHAFAAGPYNEPYSSRVYHPGLFANHAGTFHFSKTDYGLVYEGDTGSRQVAVAKLNMELIKHPKSDSSHICTLSIDGEDVSEKTGYYFDYGTNWWRQRYRIPLLSYKNGEIAEGVSIKRMSAAEKAYFINIHVAAFCDNFKVGAGKGLDIYPIDAIKMMLSLQNHYGRSLNEAEKIRMASERFAADILGLSNPKNQAPLTRLLQELVDPIAELSVTDGVVNVVGECEKNQWQGFVGPAMVCSLFKHPLAGAKAEAEASEEAGARKEDATDPEPEAGEREGSHSDDTPGNS
jgi:hypothetical protein